ASDVVWDPVYKKIYAVVPSTATSNPNTIAVVDPTTGMVVSSQAAGQEPDYIAISDDSKYVYVSLDGNGSIQRFSLPSLSPDISISLGQNPPNGPYIATSLAVAPGAPHTLAVSKGITPVQGGRGVIYDDVTPRAGNYSGGQVQWGVDQSTLCAETNGSG